VLLLLQASSSFWAVLVSVAFCLRFSGAGWPAPSIMVISRPSHAESPRTSPQHSALMRATFSLGSILVSFCKTPLLVVFFFFSFLSVFLFIFCFFCFPLRPFCFFFVFFFVCFFLFFFLSFLQHSVPQSCDLRSQDVR